MSTCQKYPEEVEENCMYTVFEKTLTESIKNCFEGIQVCLIKGPFPFPKEDKKYIDKLLKFLISRTTGPNQPNFMQSILQVGEGDSSLLEGKITPFSKGEI